MAEPIPDKHFERAKAEFLAGLQRHQAGDHNGAELHYLRSLVDLPGRASTLTNLSAVQLQLSKPKDALANADAALAAESNNAEAMLHRATALAQLGHAPQALTAYQRLLTLNASHAGAWSACGSLLREMNRLDDAAQAFREALRHGADASMMAFNLAAVTNAPAPTTAPKAYVQGLFDHYADSFDTHLVDQLHYQAHRRLVDGLEGAVPGLSSVSALDLGCGTGLCGPLVRALTKHLCGVDLSPRMLEQARALGVYDQLECADLVDFLSQADSRFDLVMAADVFIYIGDLEPVFHAVRRAMVHGVFCFSIETCEDNSEGFRLTPSLRYAHTANHLCRLAVKHGFDVIAMQPDRVREDQQTNVEGLYVYLRAQPREAWQQAAP